MPEVMCTENHPADKPRCAWCANSFEAYIRYHDEEWGVPVHDDNKHFEFLILEGAQAGLSWATILKRREAYRQAFAGFNPQQVATFDKKQIAGLLQNAGIIRNRLKIEAAVTNARHFLEVQEAFGSFNNYIWHFVNGQPIVNAWRSAAEVPATSPQSDALSKDLRQRGFKFVGSTIMYAHMQACGLVNDHEVSCFRYRELTQ